MPAPSHGTSAAASSKSSKSSSDAPEHPGRSDKSGTRQSYTLYAAGGRVYASNVRQKLVDLGSLSAEGGHHAYLLDGDHEGADGFATPRAALEDIGRTVTFIYLDGQFTALPDVRGAQGPDLADAPQVSIELDAYGPGEPAVQADA